MAIENTFNAFFLTTNVQNWEKRIPVVRLTLHTKPGIINKINQALDLLIIYMESQFDFGDEESSPFKEKLANSLSIIGANREKYYSGTLKGKSCSV